VANKKEYMRLYREKNKQKAKEYIATWRLQNKDKIRENKKAYYNNEQRKCNKCGNNVERRKLFCAECQREKYRTYMREWFRRNKYKSSVYSKASHEKLRKEIIIHYGGKCFCCGYNDIDKKVFGQAVLQVHHMNGNGRAHLKSLDISGIHFYNWLKKYNYPDGFGVLCKPCNSVMLANENICEYHKYWAGAVI
jgi:hypothetical protein